MTVLAWVRRNGGDWNGNPAADPATGTGGIDLTVLAGQPLFPIVHNSGVGKQTCNFGATAFSFAVPGGFTAGWPAEAGGFTTLDPAKVSGTYTLSNGNLTAATIALSSGAFVQAVDGYATGKYYFEVHYDTQGFITDYCGAGVGLVHPPLYYPSFCPGFGGPALNPSGADVYSNQPITAPNNHAAHLGWLGTEMNANVFLYAPGDTLCWALDMGVTPPPAVDSVTVADLWFGATDGFVDLSVAANRRKFIGVDGSTQYLATDGSIPFGLPPAVYLTLADGIAANEWANNHGTGEAFAISGPDLVLSLDRPPCGAYQSAFDADPNTPQGADPQIRLRVSDDGGRTWSLLEKWRSMGREGEYLKRLRWLKMGAFRQRIIEIQVTDPVRRNIVGFYQDVKEGMG